MGAPEVATTAPTSERNRTDAPDEIHTTTGETLP